MDAVKILSLWEGRCGDSYGAEAHSRARGRRRSPRVILISDHDS